MTYSFDENSSSNSQESELHILLGQYYNNASQLTTLNFFLQNNDFSKLHEPLASIYSELYDQSEYEAEKISEFLCSSDTANSAAEKIIEFCAAHHNDPAFLILTRLCIEKSGDVTDSRIIKLHHSLLEATQPTEVIISNIMMKFREWLLNRYKKILDIHSQTHDRPKFKKDRDQIWYLWDHWMHLYKQSKTSQEFENTWDAALSAGWFTGDPIHDPDYQKAISLFKKAESIDSAEAINRGVNYYIGRCYINLSLFDTAKTYFETSIYNVEWSSKNGQIIKLPFLNFFEHHTPGYLNSQDVSAFFCSYKTFQYSQLRLV